MTSINSSIILAFTTIIIETVLVVLFGANKSVSLQIRERIITDSQGLIYGVPIDFSYNESQISTSLYSHLPSVPGCPKSDEGYPWVYYGSPKKCYLAGEKGPCKQDQSIFVTSGSPWGFCNCNCFQGRNSTEKNGQDQFCKGFDTITCFRKEFVFKSSLRKCYTIFEQGPCKEGEWLVKTTGSTSSSAGQCEKSRRPLNQILIEVDNNRNNRCNEALSITYSNPRPTQSAIANIITNQCGSYRMKYSKLRQKCVPSFSFGFNF